ncbi:ATP-grasp domain-containing protein [Aurantimonas sp. Leaf443]|uniref:ATP-grasp domain-containing protein n=1 Tax=Aurantimonas sp. Leaf443 TaxID=1736378 RepID=UPI0006F95E94|nr:ATP-grasp domain-containing protein [Aurantimonas sp. Leaf443]KQT82842.1 hypothetical protein ASG48_15260 [Aurantimonas sp. Leaf443]
METALVLSAGFRLQYRTLQCCAPLFRAVHVFGTSAARDLSRSRLCTQFHERPDPSGKAFGGRADVAAVQALLASQRIDYLIPSDAETTRFLAEHRTAFDAKCYPVPAVVAFDQLDDKWRFAQLCGRIGVPHPETRLCATSDDVRSALAAAEAGAVFVVKPLALWGSSGVVKVTAADAAAVLAGVAYAPLLLQRYVPGPEFTTVVLCKGGRVKRAAHYRRRGSSVEFIDESEATRLAEIVASHLRIDGILVFDIKRDPRGALQVLECNPRFWYRMDVALRAGVNFVELGLWPRRFRRTARSPVRLERLDGLRTVLSRRLRGQPARFGDDALLSAVARDPLVYALMAASRLLPSRRAAGGQQL